MGENILIGVLLFAALVAAYQFGARTRRRTVTDYVPHDLRRTLSEYGSAFIGARLIGTTFSGATRGAHDATEDLIDLARRIAQQHPIPVESFSSPSGDGPLG